MSLELNGRRFMNLQEAVAWLLANNALSFQSTANYAPNTEIAKTTIINPSPAEIKVGALVLFADSKVGTVSGITTNGFMVGSEYTDIANAIAYTTNIEVNNSGHLITTLSDGRTIDAGLIKQISGISMNSSRHLIASYNNGTTQDLGLIKGVSNFSIDGSQHLIVNYDNGTSQDLGAIFSGNINISGTLNATAITGDSIIENMSGYTFSAPSTANVTLQVDYAGVCKNGNKVTFVCSGKVTKTGSTSYVRLARFGIPSSLGTLLVQTSVGGDSFLALERQYLASSKLTGIDVVLECIKNSNIEILFTIYNIDSMVTNTEYEFRIEHTFLLSTNLAA